MIPSLMILVALVGVDPAGRSGEEDLAEAEKIVSQAGLKTDSDSLLAFLRRRTLSDADRARLAATVRDLGDNSFAVRTQASADLVNAGPNAVPFLRSAIADPDLEIARRAQRCLQAIEHGPGPLVPMAAARLLAARKVAGAGEVLLKYLPFADDEGVAEIVAAALEAVAFPDGKVDPVLLAGLNDRDPARRMMAAFILAKSNVADYRQRAALLLSDPVPAVRFQAARGLLLTGDKSALPPLIALLSVAPPDLAWQVEEILGRLARDQAPELYLGEASPEERARCRTAWESWWKANEATLDLSVLKTDEPHSSGLTLIADLDRGRILAVGPDHKERWHIDGFRGPVDVQLLPSGRILVAENHASRVTERDRNGHIVWEKQTSALPASCQRLPSGHTFIAVYNQILVVGPNGKEAFTLPRPDGIYSAHKLRNGLIVLVTSTGRVVTLDANGRELRSFETGGVHNWSSLEVLPNGHCLVCCANNRVVEFDMLGKRVWECTVPNAVCATRLLNGHTLVCNSEGRCVIEVDRFGKETWRQKTEGRPWHVKRP
jgi:HEAT repeat protein